MRTLFLLLFSSFLLFSGCLRSTYEFIPIEDQDKKVIYTTSLVRKKNKIITFAPNLANPTETIRGEYRLDSTNYFLESILKKREFFENLPFTIGPDARVFPPQPPVCEMSNGTGPWGVQSIIEIYRLGKNSMQQVGLPTGTYTSTMPTAQGNFQMKTIYEFAGSELRIEYRLEELK